MELHIPGKIEGATFAMLEDFTPYLRHARPNVKMALPVYDEDRITVLMDDESATIILAVVDTANSEAVITTNPFCIAADHAHSLPYRAVPMALRHSVYAPFN